MSYGQALGRKPVDAGRILIVEDEAIIAGHISTRLEKAGFTVAGIHSSSSEVLDNIPFLKPDLVLMDIRIKGPSDGIQAAAEVRDRFDIPVIFLTAHTDQETVERAKVTGAFGFLTKPINHMSLQTTIEMALTRHRSEREVRRQHAWLGSVLESMPHAVTVVDPEGKIRYLNRAGRQLTGREDSRAIGLPPADVFAFEGAAPFWARVMEDPPRKADLPARIPEGAKIPAGRHSREIEGEIVASYEGERFAGLVGTFRDAGARQREERNRRHSAKMQALGRLAANVAHDFNNFLFVIMGFADEMLGRDCTEEFRKGALTQIVKNAQGAARLTHQLLEFSRKDSSPSGILSLNSVVQDLREILPRVLGPAIRLHVALDPAAAPVRADSGQLRQLLLNLAANAKDAMPDGGALTIATHDAGPQVRISVSDTGVGMTRETAERLFEPFFTTKPRGKGTGLGLSIAHAIVADLGGEIDVESEPGKGACFTILLPAERNP
jgi:hypothetical protein